MAIAEPIGLPKPAYHLGSRPLLLHFASLGTNAVGLDMERNQEHPANSWRRPNRSTNTFLHFERPKERALIAQNAVGISSNFKGCDAFRVV